LLASTAKALVIEGKGMSTVEYSTVCFYNRSAFHAATLVKLTRAHADLRNSDARWG